MISLDLLREMSDEGINSLWEKTVGENIRLRGIRKKKVYNIEDSVQKLGLNECWPWTGAKSSQGYGYCKNIVNGERLAHRRIWIEYNGIIPDGCIIMHLCNNPSCCNHNHLRCGTHKENMHHKFLSKQKTGGPKKPVLTAHIVNKLLSELSLN